MERFIYGRRPFGFYRPRPFIGAPFIGGVLGGLVGSTLFNPYVYRPPFYGPPIYPYPYAYPYGYGGGFVIRCNDNIYRNHRTTVRALIGDGDTDRLFGNFQSIPKPPGNALNDFRGGANQITGTLLNSSGFLTLPGVVGQYSLARVRLRRVRFANSFMKLFTRFSGNGDWMLVTQGVAIPWDRTVLPLTIFPF